jgi:hypothetical protein
MPRDNAPARGIVPGIVEIPESERRRVAAMVRVVLDPRKGRGVVARRDLPALTPLATYPGLRASAAAHAARIGRGLSDGKFAIDTFDPRRPGAAVVLDPGDARGGLLPRFRRGVAPLVNEPGAAGRPNLMWVWNLPRGRLELWTHRAVRAGRELTACYGTGGGYERDYETSCVTRQSEVEPQLHVVDAPGARPVPYGELGEAGVRAAMRRLRGGAVSGGAGRSRAGTGSAARGSAGTACGRTGRSRCTRRT